MKNNRIYSLLIISLFLFSCGGNTEQTVDNSTEEQATENMEGMMELDLTDYGLDASIQIPDESKGKAEVSETSFGSVQIIVGKNYGIEIVPFGLTVEEVKEELDGDLVYNIEYLNENSELLEYKKSIKESDVNEEFHFFYNTELDGEIYEVKSIPGMAFKKFALKGMVYSAKSLAIKNPA